MLQEFNWENALKNSACVGSLLQCTVPIFVFQIKFDSKLKTDASSKRKKLAFKFNVHLDSYIHVDKTTINLMMTD